jgi:hemoglobin
VDPLRNPTPMVTRLPSSRCTAATGSTTKRRAIACFDQALADVGLADDGALRQVLHDYFAWATTTTMSRYHQSADDVPNGLSIPHWSWDGLQV